MSRSVANLFLLRRVLGSRGIIKTQGCMYVGELISGRSKRNSLMVNFGTSVSNSIVNFCMQLAAQKRSPRPTTSKDRLDLPDLASPHHGDHILYRVHRAPSKPSLEGKGSSYKLHLQFTYRKLKLQRL